ncbi:rhomboid-like protein [Streptomyces griseosporeus]|uniref:rhomboid-like protein n=1 Tax=Streptomyces griseosporeus TaxID=1910 RepID=UPI0036F5CB53
MDRTAPAEAPASGTASGTPSDTTAPAPLADVTGLLDGVPRQRGPVRAARVAPGAAAVGPGPAPGTASASGPAPKTAPAPDGARSVRHPLRRAAGIPFTLAYAALLAVTSLVARYADPALVQTLHQASSTDVAHLLRAPVPVLLASGLWVAGGILSPYALLFLLVVGALERRIGGLRTAGVFLAGHVLATLATEIPVGLAVVAGQLPGTSLHRLDYGISFGVAACAGALSGLLRPWLGRPLLALFGASAAAGLLTLTDPMTDWGHLISLAIGVLCRPVLRRWSGAAGAHGAGAGGTPAGARL